MSESFQFDQPDENARMLGMDEQSLFDDLFRHLHLTLGREEGSESSVYLYEAAALTVRDRLVERWRESRFRRRQKAPRRVAYLSMEFLMGRALQNAILNLDLRDAVQKVLMDLGTSLEEIVDEERDAGLGNGGLGRLAACFLDSCATLRLPVIGYGILYDYGMFHQKIRNGHQIEQPDHWLQVGNPWCFKSPKDSFVVKFKGHTTADVDKAGRRHVRWINTDDVLAVPYDMPIPGYRNDKVNTLRLWRAEATEEFNLSEFNAGSYTEAVAKKTEAEQISMVLYPNDISENGKLLRLRQQYFLTSASLQDSLSLWVDQNGLDFYRFAEFNCFQLNDTHPALAVAELMRLLVDDYALSWNRAWEITSSTMAYTNHTLLPEALERWSISLFRDLLPRILEIIYEINARFLREVAARWPGDSERLNRMSIIEDHGASNVCMANLAIVGSFSVNGVAALHTELLKKGLFRDFYELWPHKFNNKTNGVTPRRWLAFCNPRLTGLIEEAIDGSWRTDLTELEKLKPFADDAAFRQRWYEIKQANKQDLAAQMRIQTGVEFDTGMLLDVQVKRIHEYKRQLLNILHVIHLYDRIIKGDTADFVPRAVLIGGKAAPGYFMAKLIIKLINNVATVVNGDAASADLLRVAFVPNYRVSTMEIICPAVDLSEQISTAGKEASGTGNMKMMMNGALTIGTLDGANIEIRDAVGEENFFLFGLRADEIEARLNDYNPGAIINSDPDFSMVMTMLETGFFDRDEANVFKPIIDSIRNPGDQWLVAADFRSYVDAQNEAARQYQDRELWTRKSIYNTANSGRFSSDRTIQEYARDIWKIKPI